MDKSVRTPGSGTLDTKERSLNMNRTANPETGGGETSQKRSASETFIGKLLVGSGKGEEKILPRLSIESLGRASRGREGIKKGRLLVGSGAPPWMMNESRLTIAVIGLAAEACAPTVKFPELEVREAPEVKVYIAAKGFGRDTVAMSGS
jgi:hypothetical protein